MADINESRFSANDMFCKSEDCPMNNKGFTLVEVLIAMAIASVIGMAGVSLFSSTNWAYKFNEDVADAQQNVRISSDRLVKDIRVAGFGLPDPPFSLSFSGLSATPTALLTPLTSPITVSNSSTGPDSITILGIGFEVGTLSKGSNTDCNDSGKGKICLGSAGNANNFFSGSGPYTYQTNRRYISLNGTTFIELATTQTDADRLVGKLTLGTPSTLDRDYRDGTQVYIIQAVNYSIDTDTAIGCSISNPCLVSRDYTMLRGGNSPGERVVVAEGIEDLQFAYGIDLNPRDGKIDYVAPYTTAAFLNSPSDPSSIIAVRASIVAKAKNPDPKVGGFTRPALEDRAAGTPDKFRRRVLTKVVKLRNPRQGS